MQAHVLQIFTRLSVLYKLRIRSRRCFLYFKSRTMKIAENRLNKLLLQISFRPSFNIDMYVNAISLENYHTYLQVLFLVYYNIKFRYLT